MQTPDTRPDHERGLEGRYRVEKVEDPSGKHAECRYFVLDPKHDKMARMALVTYIEEARRNGFLQLAEDLGAWLASIYGGGADVEAEPLVF